LENENKFVTASR